jgi:hypothetical protein
VRTKSFAVRTDILAARADFVDASRTSESFERRLGRQTATRRSPVGVRRRSAARHVERRISMVSAVRR